MENPTDAVEVLNAFALDAMAAIESYEVSEDKTSDEALKMQFRSCRNCHTQQYKIIADEAKQFGAELATPLSRHSYAALFRDLNPSDQYIFIRALESDEEKRLSRYQNSTRDRNTTVARISRLLLSEQEAVYSRIQDVMFRTGCAAND